MDRHQVVGAQKDVYLGRGGYLRLAVVDGEVQHQEEVLVMHVQFRALGARRQVFDVEGVEAEAATQPGQRRAVRLADINPDDRPVLDHLHDSRPRPGHAGTGRRRHA